MTKDFSRIVIIFYVIAALAMAMISPVVTLVMLALLPIGYIVLRFWMRIFHKIPPYNSSKGIPTKDVLAVVISTLLLFTAIALYYSTLTI